MAKKRIGELPSGSIRKKVYSHSEPCFDEHGNPIIDEKNGKPKMKKVYISITGSSAAEVNRQISEYKLNKNTQKKPDDMTLYEAIDKYISASDAVLSPSTITGYRVIQRNAFRTIMHLKLSKIDREVLKEAVNEESKRITKKRKAPISPKTVCNEYGLIVTVLDTYAPGIETDVTLPQKTITQNEISTPDVIFQMVKGTSIELPVLLAMWLSFTASEIIGLRKSKSISSDGNYITIKDVIVTDEHGNQVVKNKGKQPLRHRTLRIPPYIKELIDKVPTDQIVPLTVPALSKRWSRLVARSGIPKMTFHDLRHVNASVMALLMIPDKYAQDRGGWKTDSIMKSVYQQSFSQERLLIDQRIDDFMSEKLFGNTYEQKFEKKYECWRILFNKADTKENKKLFSLFCTQNNVCL